jgi:ankyrin repeat protein
MRSALWGLTALGFAQVQLHYDLSRDHLKQRRHSTSMVPRENKRTDALPEYASCDVDAMDEGGMTALHRAAQQGSQAHVKQLLESEANVEARTTSHGRTPLHLAAAAGHAGLLHLLTTPSTLDAQDDNNQTALQLAVRGRQLEAASALLAAGASLRAAHVADSPLRLAFNTCYGKSGAEMCELLFGAMLADPSSAGLVTEALQWRHGGDTMLHTAATHGCQQLVAQLVEAGADRDAVDDDGATPLCLAVSFGHAVLVPLLATPANINLPVGIPFWTPLYEAAGRHDERMVAALLAAGALADSPHGGNGSTLVWLARGDSSKALALLLTALCKNRAQQQQEEGRVQQQPLQQQGQQQQQGQRSLLELVAAPAALLCESQADIHGCSQLIEAVLAVLGPQMAEDVCQAVWQQLQQKQKQHPATSNKHWAVSVRKQLSYLAEALLLGWLGVEEQLHAARRPLVARLQRLVPGVGISGGQAQLQQSGSQGATQPQGQQEVGKQQLVQLLAAATLAAGAGQQQEALHLLGEFAALHFEVQQQQQRGREDFQSLRAEADSLPRLVRQSFWQADMARAHSNGNTGKPGSQADLRAASGHFSGVYTTFLAAWVGARRQLQQLPQERIVTVVAAVQVALQRQQQQQQQPQVTGACEAGEEQRVPSQLSRAVPGSAAIPALGG